MALIKKIFLISFFLVLISCKPDEPYILVEPGKVEVNKIYSVRTVDGYTLDRIVFFKPLEEGKSLFDHDSYFTKESDKRPIFNSKMNKFEMKEFFDDCIIWSREFTNFETTNLENYKIGSVEGISFDIKAQNELGLNYRGFAVAGIKDKKFYSVYFIATEMEFYRKYKEEAKKIISSIKIL